MKEFLVVVIPSEEKTCFILDAGLVWGWEKTPNNQNLKKARPFKSVVKWITLQIVIKCEIKHEVGWVCFGHRCVLGCRQPVQVNVRCAVRWKCRWRGY